MLKSRLAFSASVVAAILTIVFGILNDIRFGSLVYRSFISLVTCGFVGYIAGLLIDNYYTQPISDIKTKGQNIDITSKEEETATAVISSFSPLTPDKLEVITTETLSSSGRGVYNE